MFTLPIPRRVRTWLIRIKGVARLEHNPAVDASELWNRTARNPRKAGRDGVEAGQRPRLPIPQTAYPMPI